MSDASGFRQQFAFPSEKLSHIVHHYQWLEIGNIILPGETLIYPSLGTGFNFSFWKDKPIYIKNTLFGEKKQTPCVLISPRINPATSSGIINAKGFRILFQPGVLYAVYNIPMREFLDELVDPAYSMDAELTDVYERMWENQTFGACVEIFEDYLLHKLQRILYQPPKLLTRIDEVLSLQGIENINVNNLAHHLSMSQRQLGRYMTSQSGLSPKEYLKSYRFTLALKH
ncbi:MAG: hypothetical protein R3C61_29380, partial [Bacteroidia bacterium]